MFDIQSEIDDNLPVNTESSIYLPRELKDSLIETARSEGFSIGRGRGSALAGFVRELLLRHKETGESRELSLNSFTPAMRSVLYDLSELDPAQQEQLAAVLDGLLAMVRGQKHLSSHG